EGRGHARGGDVLLDRHRDAVQGAERLPGAPPLLAGACLPVGLRIVAVPQRVDRRLPLVDALADGAQRVDRRALARLIGAGQVDGGEVGEVGHRRWAQSRMTRSFSEMPVTVRMMVVRGVRWT